MRSFGLRLAALVALSTFAGPFIGEAAAQSAPSAPALKSAAELLGAEAYAEVAAKGKAVRTTEAGAAALLPAHGAADPIRAALAAEKPGVLVEAAFALPRRAPATAEGLEAELASIYGLLGSFNSLEGIQYWSVSHNSWRTFYAESYRVDGPESKARLADPPAPGPGELPAAETAFVFQRDLSFGANRYRYSFRSYTGAVSLESSNLTRMSFALVPMLAPGALNTKLLVIQASDAIVFYVASGAEAPDLFRGRLGKSFGNRAEALFRWFARRSEAFLG